MGLFDKKYCDICGTKIGMLGNRKLADGNMCKDCAKKLSPWFSERKQSTVSQIKEQLAWKEENARRVPRFTATRVIGDRRRVLIDAPHGWFTVADDSNIADENVDILDLADVTGCDTDIDRSRNEIYRTTGDGSRVSYNPPRYEYDFDFFVVIHVNNPWYGDMRVKLNPTSVEVRDDGFGAGIGTTGVTGMFGASNILNAGAGPTADAQYQRYAAMCEEIKAALTGATGIGQGQPTQQPYGAQGGQYPGAQNVQNVQTPQFGGAQGGYPTPAQGRQAPQAYGQSAQPFGAASGTMFGAPTQTTQQQPVQQPAAQPAAAPGAAWTCEFCGKAGNTGRFCEDCGAPRQ